MLSERLSVASNIEVVGTAIDPFIAREKILKLQPDVITLDLEMPRMGGLAFLEKLMKYHPMPVIVFSSHTPHGSDMALRALEAGAVDVLDKNCTGNVNEITRTLIDKIRAASAAARAVKKDDEPLPIPPSDFTMPPPQKIVALGASTGGTEALKIILMSI